MLSSEWESCPNCPPPCGAVPVPPCAEGCHFLLSLSYAYQASIALLCNA